MHKLKTEGAFIICLMCGKKWLSKAFKKTKQGIIACYNDAIWATAITSRQMDKLQKTTKCDYYKALLKNDH